MLFASKDDEDKDTMVHLKMKSIKVQNTMEINDHSSKHLPLCLAEEKNLNCFGIIKGWENDDRINILGWTIPLSLAETLNICKTEVVVLKMSCVFYKTFFCLLKNLFNKKYIALVKIRRVYYAPNRHRSTDT